MINIVFTNEWLFNGFHTFTCNGFGRDLWKRPTYIYYAIKLFKTYLRVSVVVHHCNALVRRWTQSIDWLHIIVQVLRETLPNFAASVISDFDNAGDGVEPAAVICERFSNQPGEHVPRGAAGLFEASIWIILFGHLHRFSWIMSCFCERARCSMPMESTAWILMVVICLCTCWVEEIKAKSLTPAVTITLSLGLFSSVSSTFPR